MYYRHVLAERDRRVHCPDELVCPPGTSAPRTCMGHICLQLHIVTSARARAEPAGSTYKAQSTHSGQCCTESIPLP